MVRGGSDFDPSWDITSLDGKVILITGGNIGLGKQSALDLSKHGPAEVWLAARNEQKAHAAITEIKDHAPNVSVRSSVSRLDILLLNAGVMGRPPGMTQEGYEVHFGTNHVGRALLLKLLEPLLLKIASQASGSEPRVVTVSSVAHKFTVAGGIKFDLLKSKAEEQSSNNLYGQSKLATLIYAREFAKHHPEIISISVHPGTVKTDLQTSGGSLLIRGFQKFVVPLIGVSVQEGVKNQLWAATATNVANGEYYQPIGLVGRGSSLSKDGELGRKLWEGTEKELVEHYV